MHAADGFDERGLGDAFAPVHHAGRLPVPRWHRLIEPARGPPRRRVAVVEQREWCHRDSARANQLQSSMSCLILWRLAISSSTLGSLFNARRIASFVAS